MRFSFFPRAALVALAAVALTLAACEGKDAHVSGPVGTSAFTRYIAMGTSISMGVQSAGLTASFQAQAWPALLAHQAGASFAIPFFNAPGCTPPIVAPLLLARFLSGASLADGDSSCAGTVGTVVPPLNNVALSGATAWTALNLTPKLTTTVGAKYATSDKARYAAVLAATQSQVTAMLVRAPSLVSVELGANEVLGAATSGALIPATAYGQTAPYTYVPASVFGAVFTAIADSVKKSGAKALILTVPKVTTLVSLRAGSELWNDRLALASFGVAVDPNCSGSANLVFTAALVPSLVARALATGSPQALSCADVPLTADYVLTPTDVTTLNGVVDQMNAVVTSLAQQNKWALVDMNAVFAPIVAARAPYSVATQLSCVSPYGQFVSLDGVHPNVNGQQLLANAAALALNTAYRFTIPTVPVPLQTAAQLCP